MAGKKRPLLVFEAGSVVNLASALINSAIVLEYELRTKGIVWKLATGLIQGQEMVCPNLNVLCLRELARIMETYHTALTFLEIDTFSRVFCRYLLLAMRNAGSKEFCPGLSQEDCAAMLGVNRSTLTRTVRELRERGILSVFTKNRAVIMDEKKLRLMADI